MLSTMGHGNVGSGVPTDVGDAFTEVAGLRDEGIDESGDLGPWVLGWGLASLIFSLLFHGPVFFVLSLLLSGAAIIARLLCGRRRRADIPQSRRMARVGLALALVGLGLACAGLVGHPLFGLGWSWQAS
jgi:hypothetical protein